jgi:hypothetical protein
MARRDTSTVKAGNDAARAALLQAAAQGPGMKKAGDSDHLGDLAWWDPVFGWKGDVTTVADIFRKHGFDPNHVLPAAPDWASAFGRAIEHVRPSLKERDLMLTDAGDGPNGERRVSVLRLTRKGQVTSEDLGTLVCPKDGAKPFIERPDSAGVCLEVIQSCAVYFNRYMSNDVRVAVVETFERAAAMPCRNRIPYIVYYLPPTAGDTVRRLADAVEECGWGRIEIFAGYKSDERSARAAVHAVNEGLEARLKAFGEEVSKYTGADVDPKKTRAKTIESKIEEAQKLRAQGTLYRTILGAAVDTIDDKVNAIESALKETLGLVESAKAA